MKTVLSASDQRDEWTDMDASKTDLSKAGKSIDDLLEYLQKKALNHHSYKYYARKTFVDSILKDECIYLSYGDGWNDREDAKLFNTCNRDTARFGQCFSFARSESVAMWYMYGRHAENGKMIDFKPRDMKAILGAPSVTYGRFNDEGIFEETYSEGRGSFSLFLTDALYFDAASDDSVRDVIRGTEKGKIRFRVIEKYSYCRKAYPWFYEMETRLVLETKRKPSLEDVTHARISFRGLGINLSDRIVVAPGYTGNTSYRRSSLKGNINFSALG